MANDAYTALWFGYEDDVFEKIPTEVLEGLENEYKLEVNDLVLQPFYGTDGNEIVGIGVELVDHNQFYGSTAIDLSDIVSKVSELKPRVEEIFRSWGVDTGPKLFLCSANC